MSLGVFAPMLEWIQELRVHSSCQAGQVLRVYLIGLLLVGVEMSLSFLALATKTSCAHSSRWA